MAIETLGAALRHINRLLTDGTITGSSDAQLLERFVAGRDAAAFEALVAHHGPMVLGVCRGILKDQNDAEDAFQATFLILVEKSATLRKHEALGPWLYQVAHRVAIRANAAAARRRACERRAGQMAASTSPSGPSAPDEQLKALHEEIARLPETLRRAVILCDLQDVPQNRAAGELRLSERTLQRRLSAGRQRLKARLIRRGLAPEGGALGSAFLRGARLAVPPAWSEATVRAALATVDHSLAAGVVSAAAKELTQEVLRIMWFQKLASAWAGLLAIGLLAWGASGALVSLQEGPSPKSTAGPNPAMKKAEAAAPQPGSTLPEVPGKIGGGGRVLGPDGRPVAGAKIYRAPAFDMQWQPYPLQEDATTGPDGRFRFLADRRAALTIENVKYSDDKAVVTATAPNYGVAWVEVPAGGRSDDLTLRLVDDRPITAQVVDLEGKPVPGATLHVLEVRAAAGDDLGPWFEAARGRKGRSDELEWRYLPRATHAPAPRSTADAEGRIRLAGIGRDRLVVAKLEGPTIASQLLRIVTRPGEAFNVAGLVYSNEATTTYYGSEFRLAAAPTKPIAGVVRDRDTKKPLAGITVTSYRLANDPAFNQMVRTTTDAQGRYRLVGMPKGEGNRIKIVPGNDQPYLVSYRDGPDSPGLDPVTADVELKRGIWIEGKVTDKVTGKPVVGYMDYHLQPGNPNLEAYGYDREVHSRAGIDEDGFYHLAGMPGPGAIGVDYVPGYLRANERDDEFGVKEVYVAGIPYPTMNSGAIARIDPATAAESLKLDVTLDPGWTFKGTVLGPDGRPLAGAWGLGLSPEVHHRGQGLEVMKTAEFTVSGYNPRRPRPIIIQQPQKGLVGIAQPPKDRGDSITVQLQPGAAVTGRLVDAEGRPRPGVELVVYREHKEQPVQPGESVYFPTHSKTDQQGRFRIEGLLPGYLFALSDEKGDRPLGEGLRSGETKDLGDLTFGDE